MLVVGGAVAVIAGAVPHYRVCDDSTVLPRRYRTVPLEAFVKGHLRVISSVTTKLFD